MKTCKTCQKSLPLTDFYNQRKECKSCYILRVKAREKFITIGRKCKTCEQPIDESNAVTNRKDCKSCYNIKKSTPSKKSIELLIIQTNEILINLNTSLKEIETRLNKLDGDSVLPGRLSPRNNVNTHNSSPRTSPSPLRNRIPRVTN